MISSIPPRLFAEWRAYAQLEPFGEFRDDLRIAKLEQALWNIHACDYKVRPNGFTIDEFLLNIGDQKPRSDKKKAEVEPLWKRQKRALMHLAHANADIAPSDRPTIKRERKKG